VVDIEGEEIIYTREDINNLLLAYASNPYKFQGSQCKYIINVVIPTHARSWNRNLLYTSQTRMTTKLIEIGDPEMIYDAIQQNGDDSRKTRLKEFLCT
jgi:exodeoxyribonuclease V alpha subunit